MSAFDPLRALDRRAILAAKAVSSENRLSTALEVAGDVGFCAIILFAADWSLFFGLRNQLNIAGRVTESENDHMQESYLKSTKWHFVGSTVLITAIAVGLAASFDAPLIEWLVATSGFGVLAWYRLVSRKTGYREPAKYRDSN